MSDVTGEPSQTAEQNFEHDGAAATLAPIVIVNTLLTIITLSIYRFWAKTRVRQYLWDQTSLDGDRLEYSGTGKELFYDNDRGAAGDWIRFGCFIDRTREPVLLRVPARLNVGARVTGDR